jgi:hypothetical protein
MWWQDVVAKVPGFEPLWEDVPHLLHILTRRLSTIAQITVLRAKVRAVKL